MDVRVYVVDHGPRYNAILSKAYEAHKSVEKSPDHRFFAFAVTGTGERAKVEASGFGATEDDALAALEAEVTAPPPPKRVRAGQPIVGKDTRRYHLARALDPEQAFHSICAVEGCGKVVVRLSGREARRSDWRHAKPTERF